MNAPSRKILKILLLFTAGVVVVAALLFAVGYFYYSGIVKSWLATTIERESKGVYHAEIGSLRLDLLNGNLTVREFRIEPDTARYSALARTDTLPPMLIGLKIDEFRIRDFDVVQAIRQRRIDIRLIRFMAPEITVFRMRNKPAGRDTSHSARLTSIPLPPGLSGIAIGELTVEKAVMTVVDRLTDSTTVHHFPETDIRILGILVDSAHAGQEHIFNAGDIRITLGGYTLKTANGMNRISFGEIGLSTGTETVYVRNFHLEPLYGRQEYSRKLGYQTDRMDVRIPEFRIERLDMRKLLFEGKLIAGRVTIDSLALDDYRDKRVPERKNFRPAMPHEAIRKIRAYLFIDTLVVRNGKAVYSEQVNEKPGTLFFDKMNVTVTGITNDSVLLKAGLQTGIQGTTYLMGVGRLDLTMFLRTGDPANGFRYSARLGPMDLRAINPMVENLLPARVESGRVTDMVITQVTANDHEAAGKMIFRYSDLKINVIDKQQTTWGKIRSGVINFAANELVVSNSNPTSSGKLKTGTIYFRRDKHKGFFNFLWKSSLSGLKSTMGFNSKAQKAMIQSEKARQK